MNETNIRLSRCYFDKLCEFLLKKQVNQKYKNQFITRYDTRQPKIIYPKQ